jgi:capsid protein
MNFLDRAISAVSPAAGLKRAQARAELGQMQGAVTITNSTGGYEGSGFGREAWSPAWNRALQADEETNLNRYDRDTQILTLEDMYRNNEFIGGIVDRMADYVVHTGIRPQAQTKSREWNDEAESYFMEWAKIADYRQRPGMDFWRMQWMSVVDRCLRGESAYIPLANGQLQPIETSRIRTPAKLESDQSIRMGVKYSPAGLCLGYYVCDVDSVGQIKTDAYQFVAREDIFHISYPWRVAQARGVPALARLINKVTHVRDADKFTLLKLKNDARIFLKETRKGGQGFGALGARNSRTADDGNGNKQRMESAEWGMHWHGSEGEDLQSFESRTPHSGHVPYLEWQCKTIGMALGLPWEFVLMVFTEGSFSAQRTALLHGLHKFIQWHSDTSRYLCQRVWNWRIAKAMKEGDLSKAPLGNGVSQWYRVDWSLPNMGWVDPEAAAKAQMESWRFGKTSLKRISNSEGADRTDIFDEKAEDISDAITKADELNKKHPGAGVVWQDIIGVGQAAPAAPAPVEPPAVDPPATTEPPAVPVKGKPKK